MRILIVDDDFARHIRFTQFYRDFEILHAYTSLEAIQILQTTKSFSLILLDHDLELSSEFLPGHDSPDYDTAIEVAEYLVQHKDEFNIGTICIHSLNKEGAQHLKRILEKGKFSITVVPYKEANNA